MNTGKIIKGHVLDCNKKHLEMLLRRYDPQLYLKWNPYKTILTNGKTRIMPPEGDYWQGWGVGCWELRRRPNAKTAVPRWQIGETIFFDVDYVEHDVENHIKDLQYLNYELLGWVKNSDCWATKNWVNELEYSENKAYEKKLDKDQDDLKYRIRHEHRAMQEFQDLIKAGRNPLEYLGGVWPESH